MLTLSESRAHAGARNTILPSGALHDGPIISRPASGAGLLFSVAGSVLADETATVRPPCFSRLREIPVVEGSVELAETGSAANALESGLAVADGGQNRPNRQHPPMTITLVPIAILRQFHESGISLFAPSLHAPYAGAHVATGSVVTSATIAIISMVAPRRHQDGADIGLTAWEVLRASLTGQVPS